MNSLPHILVFDSGAGGLSIAKTILDSSHRSLRMSYFADKSAFPYGEKDESFLVSHVCKLIDEFIRQHNPELIVIACNTASTVVLPELRRRFNCPFVGVVPAIKPAAQLSSSKSIGVLATPATVKREYTSALIAQFAPDCKVSLHGSDKLVRCAENFIITDELDMQTLAEELSLLFCQQNDIDTVVLACTHFPLILNALEIAAPNVVNWVDSSEAIARRAFHLLADIRSTDPSNTRNHEIDIFFSTDNLEDVAIDALRDIYRNYLVKIEA